MAWSERQRAMLDVMGLRVWAPAAAQEPPEALTAAAAVTAAQAPLTAVEPPVSSQPVPAPATVRQRLTGVETLDWADLRDAVAACRACSLCESRGQTVFGVGHAQAHWMVVGEAPGEQEDLQGEPFVGASGQLLDRMLAALGLTRSEDGPEPPAQRVYIANTLKCRPPRNRNPTPEEMLKCEPFLVRQIQLVKPRIILAMGAFAVKALLRSDQPVGKLRGQVHRYEGVPLVVTYHPAYLLRSLPEKAKAWEDLCLAASVVEAGGPP